MHFLGNSLLTSILFQVHLFLEPFCVCLKRNLAVQHPLNQILKFHCRELVIPNTLGTPALISEDGFLAKLFAYGIDGADRLVQDGHKLSTWEETDLRSKIKVWLALQPTKRTECLIHLSCRERNYE